MNVNPGQTVALGTIKAEETGNFPPHFTSPAQLKVEEGKSAVGTVVAIDRDEDEHGDYVTGYAKVGGKDEDAFEIDAEGKLAFDHHDELREAC